MFHVSQYTAKSFSFTKLKISFTLVKITIILFGKWVEYQT